MPEKYSCFITCCHADNSTPGRQWADWLSHAFEEFVIPTTLAGTVNARGGIVPPHIIPLFSAEAAPFRGPTQARDVRQALEDSGVLIVLCSPRVARMPFAEEEIRYFKELGRQDRILAILLEGKRGASEIPGGALAYLECLPESLRVGVANEDGMIDWSRPAEPSLVDVRLGGSTEQGWTSGEAYHRHLFETAGAADDLDTKVAAYQQRLQETKIQIVAWMLGVAPNALRMRRRKTSGGFETETDWQEYAQAREHPALAPVYAPAAASPAIVTSAPAPSSNALIHHAHAQFTVCRPKVITPHKWHTLLTFAHLSEKPAGAALDEPDPLGEVWRQARQALSGNASTQEDAGEGREMPREGELTLVPFAEGIEFSPRQLAFRWEEPLHREDFRFRTKGMPVDLPRTVRGNIAVFLGAIVVADIPIAFHIDALGSMLPAQNIDANHARPYRKIFACHSPLDGEIAARISDYANGAGDQFLRETLRLRALHPDGEGDPRLLQMIAEADVFQLFWSTNSMRSPQARREWEHALSLERVGFIRPTYWEEPFPTAPDIGMPPPALNRLYFQKIRSLTPPPSEPEEIIFTPPPEPVLDIPAAHGAPARIQLPVEPPGAIPLFAPPPSRRGIRAFLLTTMILLAGVVWKQQHPAAVTTTTTQPPVPAAAATGATATAAGN